MARPQKQIDIEQLKKLAAINCSNEEMALILNIDKRTLERRFAAVIKEGRASGKMSVKRMQFKVAMDGHPSMLIWLGKIMCGQSEQFNIQTATIEKVVEMMRECFERVKSEGTSGNRAVASESKTISDKPQ